MNPVRGSHSERNQAAFSRQAGSFEDPSLNQAFTSGLERLVAAIAPESAELCLDVAAGTGHVSRAVAPHVKTVVAIDAVEEMLAEGARKAREAGLSNIVFQAGDAMALPFLDDSFEIVVTRLSLHHLNEPGQAVSELVRVCRPGGRVVIVDLVRDPARPSPDRLEQLRDPSHLRVLTVEEIASALARAGAVVAGEDIERRQRPLDTWLEQAGTPAPSAEEVRTRIRAELEGGEPTGLDPVVREGVTCFVQLWATVTATCKHQPGRTDEPGPLAPASREELK